MNDPGWVGGDEGGGRPGERPPPATRVIAWASRRAINPRRIDLEVGQAVPSKPVKLFSLIVIDARIKRVVVKVDRARTRIVRLVLGRGHVGRWYQLQKVGRLGCDSVGRDHVAGKLYSSCRRSAA